MKLGDMIKNKPSNWARAEELTRKIDWLYRHLGLGAYIQIEKYEKELAELKIS